MGIVIGCVFGGVFVFGMLKVFGVKYLFVLNIVWMGIMYFSIIGCFVFGLLCFMKSWSDVFCI